MATQPTKTTYTVTEVPGSKRASARTYTHAIVGRVNAAARRTIANSDEVRAQHLKNWNWHATEGKMKEGDLIHYTNTDKPWSVPMTKERLDEHLAFLAKHPDGAEFVQFCVDEQVRLINKCYGEGAEGPLEVLQWSQSATNAQKSLSSWKHRLGVRIVECVPVAKPARKSKRVESAAHEANNI